MVFAGYGSEQDSGSSPTFCTDPDLGNLYGFYGSGSFFNCISIKKMNYEYVCGVLYRITRNSPYYINFLLIPARKVHKSEMIQSENGGPDCGVSILLLGAMLWSTMLLRERV